MNDGGPGPQPTWATHAADGADEASLVALANINPAALSGADLVDAITASEKALSWLAGMQMRLMAAFAEPFKAGDPMRLAARLARKHCITGDDDPDQVQQFIPAAAASLAAAEIAATLRIPHLTAGNRVREAETMTTTLAPTLEALEQGVLDRSKARIIEDHCRPLTPEHTAAVQELVLPDAANLNTSELRELTAHAVITVDPDGSMERHRSAAARREFSLRPQPDAMATLSAYLPADGAVKIFQVTDLLATASAGCPGDTRGIGARRVDALIDIADHLLTHGYLDIGRYLDHPLPDHGAPPLRHNGHIDDHTRTAGSETAATNSNHETPTTPAPGTGDNTDTAGDNSSTVSENPCAVGEPRSAGEDPTVGGTSVSDNSGTAVDNLSGVTDLAGRAEDGAGSGRGGASVTARRPDPAQAAVLTPQDVARRRRALTRQGRRPHLSVIIDETTLAGLNEFPGHLHGFGAIPADLARSIAQSAASITALLADQGTGVIKESGALTYRPKQALRDQIAAQRTVCQFPSCRQPVWRCDLDHRESFDHHHPDQGGSTDPENTGPLCRRHHLFKHHSQWRLHPDPDGYTMHFTSPTGHDYPSAPRPPLPTHARFSVTTNGTALAERLDAMTAFTDATTTRRNTSDTNAYADATTTAGSDTDPAEQTTAATTSSVEDLLTALLIRHAINDPGYEYDPLDTGEQPDNDDEPPY